MSETQRAFARPTETAVAVDARTVVPVALITLLSLVLLLSPGAVWLHVT